MSYRFTPIALAIASLASVTSTTVFAENELNTVVVTANRTQETKRELSTNVTVISNADIKNSAASTLSDLMQRQGFFVATTGDSSNVMIRGYGSTTLANEPENTILTLINGHRTGSANLALISLANVERIEIIRGPSAVQFGSSALGGVINVITKKGSQENSSGSFEIGGGSDGLLRERFSKTGAIGNFDYSIGLTNFSRNDATTSEFGRWYHTEIKNNTSGLIDLGYNLDKNNRISLLHNQGEIQSNLPGTGNYIRKNNTPSTTYSQYKKANQSSTLSYTGNTEGKDFDWSGSYTSGREDSEYKAYGYTNFIENESFNLQTGYHNSLLSLSVGFDQTNYNLYASNAPTKLKMSDDGAYFASKIRLLEERLILSINGRYDQYKNTALDGAAYKNHHYGESYGLAWIPEENLKFRMNYAEGFKMPSPKQAGGQAPYYNPNPSLMPEIGKTWEIGSDIYWDRAAASLTYFQSTYENKIIGVSTPGLPRPYQYQNIKDAELSGVEGNIRSELNQYLNIHHKIQGFLSFTWLKTRKTNDSTQFITYNGSKINTLPNTPEWMFSYGLDFENQNYQLKGHLNAYTYGAVLVRDWSQSSSPYITRPAGTVVNLSFDKELPAYSSAQGKLSIRAEINNIFDGRNEMYFNYPGQGRNYYLGLKYDY